MTSTSAAWRSVFAQCAARTAAISGRTRGNPDARPLSAAGPLADRYDSFLMDLDGVLYPMRIEDFSRFGFTDVLFPELVGQPDD